MKDKEKEETLKRKLSDLQEKRDEMESVMDKVWKAEEEDDDKLLLWNKKLDDMMSNMTVKDSKIDELLEERQYVLQMMRSKRQEFLDELEEDVKQERKNLDNEEENIKAELSSKDDEE